MLLAIKTFGDQVVEYMWAITNHIFLELYPNVTFDKVDRVHRRLKVKDFLPLVLTKCPSMKVRKLTLIYSMRGFLSIASRRVGHRRLFMIFSPQV